jgi:hypothetical protein
MFKGLIKLVLPQSSLAETSEERSARYLKEMRQAAFDGRKGSMDGDQRKAYSKAFDLKE